jgi:hypothetical protein
LSGRRSGGNLTKGLPHFISMYINNNDNCCSCCCCRREKSLIESVGLCCVRAFEGDRIEICVSYSRAFVILRVRGRGAVKKCGKIVARIEERMMERIEEKISNARLSRTRHGITRALARCGCFRCIERSRCTAAAGDGRSLKISGIAKKRPRDDIAECAGRGGAAQSPFQGANNEPGTRSKEHRRSVRR